MIDDKNGASPPGDAPGANKQSGDEQDFHDANSSADLRWVWREVRKRVFIKLPFSLGVAEALQAVVPIVLDEDTFVVGLTSRDYPLSGNLSAENVRNTIENILRQASRRYIRFEVIEGTTIEEWNEVKKRRDRAREAIIAMAEHKVEEHHYEDVLNQIIGEIRHRISSRRDRGLPQVRAGIMLDIVPSLGDATEMLFHDPDTHEARRIMARVIDRVSGFLDVPAIVLSIEIERYRREQKPSLAKTGPVAGQVAAPAPNPAPEPLPTPLASEENS